MRNFFNFNFMPILNAFPYFFIFDFPFKYFISTDFPWKASKLNTQRWMRKMRWNLNKFKQNLFASNSRIHSHVHCSTEKKEKSSNLPYHCSLMCFRFCPTFFSYKKEIETREWNRRALTTDSQTQFIYCIRKYFIIPLFKSFFIFPSRFSMKNMHNNVGRM